MSTPEPAQPHLSTVSVESNLGDDGPPHSENAATGRSTVLIALLASFEMQKIAYCCWKSSRRASRGLAGASDLDLLIARCDRQRATELLLTRGFKHWPDAPGLDHPAVMSFLGYDETSGAIHHVHIQFRLIFGHSLLKNFHLPGEEQFIARSAHHPTEPLRVLHPVDEALLLVVRTQLELRWLDPIAVRHWTALRQKAADDLAALAPRVDRAALRERAAQFFSPELADAIAEQLGLDGQTFSRLRIRARIARELSAYRMYGGAEAFLRTIGRTAIWAIRAINKRYFRLPRLWGRRTPGGGCVISFIGVDGSGKSTSLREISNWLGRETDVMTCYFGTGDGKPSLLFRPFKAAASLAARLVRTRPKGASHGTVSDRPLRPGYSVLFAIWAIAVALEKRRKLIATQRAVSRGFVVVTDRYPQNQIKQFNDGPLLHRLQRSPAWLARFEESIYMLAQRAPPDLVIKLHVGAETIARREPNMIPSIISQRIAWLTELKFSPARVVSIDATKPLDEVIRIAKREIWSIL